MKKEVFIVHREGVYRHEVVGVYTDAEVAKQAAITAIKSEGDDYHDFSVIRCPLNTYLDNDGELIVRYTRKSKEYAELNEYTYI